MEKPPKRLETLANLRSVSIWARQTRRSRTRLSSPFQPQSQPPPQFRVNTTLSLDLLAWTMATGAPVGAVTCSKLGTLVRLQPAQSELGLRSSVTRAFGARTASATIHGPVQAPASFFTTDVAVATAPQPHTGKLRARKYSLKEVNREANKDVRVCRHCI